MNPVFHMVNKCVLGVGKWVVEFRVPMGGEGISHQGFHRLEVRWVRVFS